MTSSRRRRRTLTAVGAVAALGAMAACGAGRAQQVRPAAPTDRPIAPVSVDAGAKAVRTGPCSAAQGGPPNGCPTPPPGGKPVIGGCTVFPADNPWNQDVSTLPVHPNSANYIARINSQGGTLVHPDFGSNPSYGIPFLVVPDTQPLVPITYDAYGAESDPGPFPIPLSAPVEAGSDRHVLVVQSGACQLYELGVGRAGPTGWTATVGVHWDLASNALRPLRWTSADAAGLPILPGLARFDEVAADHIDHALRFTVDETQMGFVLPATHYASSVTNPNAPPMGLRFRLRADFDRSRYTGESRVILDALARYGMIVADNGSNRYISGATDGRWDDDDLNQLKGVPGTAFEVVDTGPVQT